MFVSGCAANTKLPEPDHRRIGRFFTVEFSPAEGSEPNAKDPYYRITRNAVSGSPLRVMSRLKNEKSPMGAAGSAAGLTRLIEGTDGRHLIIEEEFPNDAWPVKSYILVSATDHRPLEYTFLRVPEAPYEGTPNDPSKVISLDGDVLTFRYANGTQAHRRLEDIPKMAKPKQP